MLLLALKFVKISNFLIVFQIFLFERDAENNAPLRLLGEMEKNVFNEPQNVPREALNLPLVAIIEKHSHHHLFCFAEKKVNKPVMAESFTSKLFPPSIDDADDGNQEKFSRKKERTSELISK